MPHLINSAACFGHFCGHYQCAVQECWQNTITQITVNITECADMEYVQVILNIS